MRKHWALEHEHRRYPQFHDLGIAMDLALRWINKKGWDYQDLMGPNPTQITTAQLESRSHSTPVFNLPCNSSSIPFLYLRALIDMPPIPSCIHCFLVDWPLGNIRWDHWQRIAAKVGMDFGWVECYGRAWSPKCISDFLQTASSQFERHLSSSPQFVFYAS